MLSQYRSRSRLNERFAYVRNVHTEVMSQYRSRSRLNELEIAVKVIKRDASLNTALAVD